MMRWLAVLLWNGIKVLLSQIQAFHARVQAAGVRAELHVTPEMVLSASCVACAFPVHRFTEHGLTSYVVRCTVPCNVYSGLNTAMILFMLC